MKRFLLLMIILACTAAALSASPTFSAHLGMDLFNYEQNFLDTGIVFLNEFEENMEFNAGIDFAITTEENGGNVNPSFFIPIDLGLNFLFPQKQMSFLFGTGFSTVFHSLPDEGVFFYTGPYMKGGLRVKVHPLMRWFVEIQQNLLIGKPKWINTTTRIYTGINFSIGRN